MILLIELAITFHRSSISEYSHYKVYNDLTPGLGYLTVHDSVGYPGPGVLYFACVHSINIENNRMSILPQTIKNNTLKNNSTITNILQFHFFRRA